ncbi:ArsR/SmtB family transcription factor [Methanoculleus sp. 7T]|uniref:ArsR/SmtB family transcription factor n=1 Tax=Methanoculleus sp. 7T TaxID=2937282 RepID=UPI0032C08957
MTEDEKYQDASLPLPPDIEESLYRCGGIAGLVEQLPGDPALKRQSTLYRALADPLRLKILAMLSVQSLCVCVIKAVLSIADSKLSYHLSVLKKAGLIAGEAQGNWIIYRLTDDGAVWTARPGMGHDEQANTGNAERSRPPADNYGLLFSLHR